VLYWLQESDKSGFAAGKDVKMVLDQQKLEVLKIQPVGDGPIDIDLICSPAQVDSFINLCNIQGVSIRGFTWWCHVIDGHEPCGMGGPKSKYYDGWFSEIPMYDIIRLPNNEAYRNYFKNIWPTSIDYHSCYWPGFWLEE